MKQKPADDDQIFTASMVGMFGDVCPIGQTKKVVVIDNDVWETIQRTGQHLLRIKNVAMRTKGLPTELADLVREYLEERETRPALVDTEGGPE
jgi:hypothetical protein